MAVITCSDMARQCQDGHPAGWRHFVKYYLPFAAALVDRHCSESAPKRDALLEEVLQRSRGQNFHFFRNYQGQSEREFLLYFRDYVLAIAQEQAAPPERPPQIVLEWELFQRSLEGFSLLERQAIWMFLLCPWASDWSEILNLEPKSAHAILAKAQDAMRAAYEEWNPEMLPQNRNALAQTARSLAANNCPATRAFVRLLDGQITWRDRADIERHTAGCWCCVDVLCRLREAAFVARRIQPLPDAETERYLSGLGIGIARPSKWKRFLGKP